MKKIFKLLCIIFLIIIFRYIIIFIDNIKVIKNVSAIDNNININDMEDKIDWSKIEKYYINLNGDSLNIYNEGIYIISGRINNGSINIDTSDNIKLVFNNVYINNDNGSTIRIENVNNIILEMEEGSDNTLINSSEYEGCIYVKDNLILQGNGILRINSKYYDGIVVNDNLKIENGTYIINSNGDGIRGKDSVYIVDGEFNINSGADGIKSTNRNALKGYINIDNGNFNINSVGDGIESATKLIINNGTFNIKTSNGSEISQTEKERYYNGRLNRDESSSKGLKARSNIIIMNGNISIDSKGDAIHSNNHIGIVDGIFNIKTNDDAFHADKDLIVDGGNIDVSMAFEGIEATNVTINNGKLNIIVSDDGINTSGNRDLFNTKYLLYGYGSITINDGDIYICSFGDGIDSNGSIVINGGKIHIDGPTDIGNGAFDYEMFFYVNGGEYIGVSSIGGAMNAVEDSKQDSILIKLPKICTGKLSLKDQEGNIITEYTPRKEYQSLVISNDKIDKNKQYTVYVNDEKVYG